MSSGLENLTEKEKQTLRLLLAGHDAKSMARQLELSIHTVNERLRDARRKLGASSSREAARLLREQEGGAPDLSVPHQMRAATAAGAGQPDPLARTTGQGGRSGWIIGGIAMSLSLALAALSSLGSSAQPVVEIANHGTAAAETEVVEAARQWLALVDARDWKGAWSAAASGIRSANSVTQFSQVVEQVHGKLGAARLRELAVVEEVPAPPHGYWLVKFRASYANKPQGMETLSLARENGAWKVSGITVD